MAKVESTPWPKSCKVMESYILTLAVAHLLFIEGTLIIPLRCPTVGLLKIGLIYVEHVLSDTVSEVGQTFTIRLEKMLEKCVEGGFCP